MIFNFIDVSLIGPFAQNQVLHLDDEVNLIQGPNGSGKTTIFHELMRLYREGFDRDDLPLEVATKLTFIGENYAHESKRGQDIVAAGNLLRGNPCMHVFPQLISHYVNQLVAKKVLWGRSKFGQPADICFPFVVSINKTAALQISNSVGVQIDGKFSAAGESFLVALACNLALRDLLDFRDPFVVDGAFGMLDESLLPSCFDKLLRTRSQKIFLISKDVCEQLQEKPHYLLAADQHERTSVVTMRA